MITVDYDIAIAAYLSFAITLVYGLWLFYTYRDERIERGDENLHHCIYCGYPFRNFTLDKVLKCPRCHSLNEFKL